MSEQNLGPIKVTVSDPESGKILEEKILENDFLLLCHGTSRLVHENFYPKTGTAVLTIKKGKP